MRPFQVSECDGTGATPAEAIDAAHSALLQCLKAKTIILPPLDMLDPEDLKSGRALRIERDTPE